MLYTAVLSQKAEMSIHLSSDVICRRQILTYKAGPSTEFFFIYNDRRPVISNIAIQMKPNELAKTS